MTPREFNQAYKGYMWGQERKMKDIGWLMSTIINFCKQPSKSRKTYKGQDFIRTGTDSNNRKNPFYRQILGIR